MSKSAARVAESVAYIRQYWKRTPHVGLILGTGLSDASERMTAEWTREYDQIPNFQCATALSHRGRLVCGELAGVPAVAMAGRCHLYEGYDFAEVTLPVRVLAALGVKLLIVSNASGGLNPHYQSGDIMVIADHLNFQAPRGRASQGCQDGSGSCPARQPRGKSSEAPADGLPSRFPTAWCYDADLLTRAQTIARREGFAAHCGVYVAVLGPNFETRAEYRMFRRLGGDAVGMSTVPEVLTAASLGMRVLALSMVTNLALPDAPRQVDPHEVVVLATRAEPNLTKIVQGIAADTAAGWDTRQGNERQGNERQGNKRARE